MAGTTSSVEWVPTNAPAPTSRYDDVYFIDTSYGWAVNSSGQVISTEDGGESWRIRATFEHVYLRCIGFADRQNGWLGTLTPESPFFRTFDGGATWHPIKLPPGSPPRICGLHVFDESTIFAVGSNRPNEPSAFIKTRDGGESWECTALSPEFTAAVDVFFENALDGWIACAIDTVRHPSRQPDRKDLMAAVLCTSDGGATWKNMLVDKMTIRQLPVGEWSWKIQILPSKTVMVSTQNYYDGALLKTTDHGATWTRVRINDRQRTSNIQGFGFINDDLGWAGGWGDYTFLKGLSTCTLDGGVTWNDANNIGKNINRFRLVSLSPLLAYAAGEDIYRITESSATARNLALLPRHAQANLQLFKINSGGAYFKVDAKLNALSPRLKVIDHYGPAVATLASCSSFPDGSMVYFWNFEDENGVPCPSGAYIIRLNAGEISESILISTTSEEVNAQLSFANDIRPLFRQLDRDSMIPFGLDLHSCRDVKMNFDEIYRRLSDGSMPCDTEWSQDEIHILKVWYQSGAFE